MDDLFIIISINVVVTVDNTTNYYSRNGKKISINSRVESSQGVGIVPCYSHTYTYIYKYILSSRDRVLRCITTLQWVKICRTLEAGIETHLTLR